MKIPRLNEQTNNARIGHATCLPEKQSNNSDKLEIIAVSNYTPVDLLRHKHKIYNSREATDEEEEARISEIISNFQWNLNHPYLKALYIFVEFQQSMDYLRSLNLKNSEKLVIQWENKTITLANTLKYIHKCLQGHIVSMMHQDNRFGAGFDKLHPSTLIDNKLMYALTRQPAYESYCFYSWEHAHCERNKGVWSQDAFIFHVKDFSQDSFNEMVDAGGNEFGIEDLLILMFRKKLGYKVINPCLVLHVHHEHCVPIRTASVRRFKSKEPVTADVTDKLI